METDKWLTGWKAIGKYIGKSSRTAQRYAKEGMPFYRDPGGRPISKPAMIDEYILDLNQSQYDNKVWKDEGIDTALSYEGEKEKARKDLNEKVLLAQRPTRGLY